MREHNLITEILERRCKEKKTKRKTKGKNCFDYLLNGIKYEIIRERHKTMQMEETEFKTSQLASYEMKKYLRAIILLYILIINNTPDLAICNNA